MRSNRNSIGTRALNLVLAILICSSAALAQDPQLAPEKKRADRGSSLKVHGVHATFPDSRSRSSKMENTTGPAGFGLADVENNSPASEHTLYRLASISKSLTATAAMQLQERGRLDLDAPVQKYCPAFPAETVADQHKASHGTPRRHPPLQRRARRPRNRQHEALRQSDPGWPRLLQE